MKLEATFSLERETKGAVRYQEQDEEDNPKIGTLYIKKSALRGERPKIVHVQITDGNGDEE